MKSNGLFKGKEGGITSMRRVLAFLFAIASIIAGLWSTFDGQSWGNICASILSFGLLSTMMMGLTTMEDINKITGNIKGGGNNASISQ